MTVREVRTKAARLKSSRANADVAEEYLRVSLSELLAHGEAVSFAKQTGVTPQYLSDIRKGNRRISDEFVDRVVKISSSGRLRERPLLSNGKGRTDVAK